MSEKEPFVPPITAPTWSNVTLTTPFAMQEWFDLISILVLQFSVFRGFFQVVRNLLIYT